MSGPGVRRTNKCQHFKLIPEFLFNSELAFIRGSLMIVVRTHTGTGKNTIGSLEYSSLQASST